MQKNWERAAKVFGDKLVLGGGYGLPFLTQNILNFVFGNT